MNVLESINEIVESRIRPALQSHGGDITVISFDEDSGVLSASLRGACGTCPFAQETLRSQVEEVLKEQIPQITSVVRV